MHRSESMRPPWLHRRIRLLATLPVLLAGCSDSTAPNLAGPAFFTAEVNGRPWSPSDTSAIQTGLRLNRTFMVNAWQGPFPQPPYQLMSIGNVHISGPGVYRFAVSSNGSDATFIGPSSPGDSAKAFYTDSTHTGQLYILALDTTVHRVVGTFFFSAVSSAGTIVKITHGQFRLTYYQYPF